MKSIIESINESNKKDIERIVNNLKYALEIAGDGGPTPFDDKEYNEMYNFLDSLLK